MNKDFIKRKLEQLGRKHGIGKVFEDFVICSAYAISNSVYYDQNKEDSYLAIAKKYNEEELKDFAQMLAKLYEEYEKEDYVDVLGEIYEEYQLQDKSKGQFFTPLNICNMMNEITIDKENVEKTLEEKGYISICDCACGSGRMLISSAETLRKLHVDNSKVYYEAADVSLFCSCMTYINLSLLGLNGIVKNQDSLSGNLYGLYYTPAFGLNKELQEKVLNLKESEKANEQ